MGYTDTPGIERYQALAHAVNIPFRQHTMIVDEPSNLLISTRFVLDYHLTGKRATFCVGANGNIIMKVYSSIDDVIPSYKICRRRDRLHNRICSPNVVKWLLRKYPDEPRPLRLRLASSRRVELEYIRYHIFTFSPVIDLCSTAQKIISSHQHL